MRPGNADATRLFTKNPHNTWFLPTLLVSYVKQKIDMKAPDYLGKSMISEADNFEVFQATYKRVELLSNEMLDILKPAYMFTDKEITEFAPLIFKTVEKHLTESVNLAIHKYKK